jgi:hypothetical protein
VFAQLSLLQIDFEDAELQKAGGFARRGWRHRILGEFTTSVGPVQIGSQESCFQTLSCSDEVHERTIAIPAVPAAHYSRRCGQ